MSDCRFGVSPVNYPDPDPDHQLVAGLRLAVGQWLVWPYASNRSRVSK